ncbi:MAG: SMC-Scp complex subunit ScpB, partial [Bifidobacteriaceae bacterium]|nr:SMC-Scp complex subunit ScpB [Bifidobacteriaceae bacterium]
MSSQQGEAPKDGRDWADATPAGEDGDPLGHATELSGTPDLTRWTGLSVRAALEAVLMVVDEPVPTAELAVAVARPIADVEATLGDLAAEYRGQRGGEPRGFELRDVGGGWRIYSAPAYSGVVEQFLREGHTAKLTQAALETLAIIAYRGPISRGRIGAIRGVNADSVVRTLLSRGLIDEVGTDESTGAHLYATTALFLERLGLTTLDELEALAPHLPGLDALADIEEQI